MFYHVRSVEFRAGGGGYCDGWGTGEVWGWALAFPFRHVLSGTPQPNFF